MQQLIQHDCPITTQGGEIFTKNESLFLANFVGISPRKKGGTVVPPSNFQFVTTEGLYSQRVTDKFPRPHGPAGAHTRREPLAPTQISLQKCGDTTCPYYGHMATYCQICSVPVRSVTDSEY